MSFLTLSPSHGSFCAFCMLFASLVFACCVALGEASTVLVDSPFGKIKGLQQTDEETGQTFVSFRGIPYARPPVGELRFAKPQPHPKLDDVFDGTHDKKRVCPHPEHFPFGETEFTEDCLILNVYARDVGEDRGSGTALRKVVAFIHGGAFVAGTSYLFNPRSFVQSQDVLVVTLNYRLGILGFLSTENEASPGNYGLWDQTLALRWVKDNIRAFGGDPDDITIAGESAGGASVAYQMISPHAKGLFTKAYPQSGTATSVFAQSMDTLSLTLHAAKGLGCWDKDAGDTIGLEESTEVIRCLRQLPESKFASFTELSLLKSMFVPVVDGDFISDSPRNLLKDDTYLDSIGFFDRSYLVAINNNEAWILHKFSEIDKADIFLNNETTAEEKESMFKGLLSNWRQMTLESRLGEKGFMNSKVVDAINDFYDRRYGDSLSALEEISADLNFLIPSMDFLQAMSRRDSCNGYLLYFDHFPDFMRGARRGVPHAVDLAYWFDVMPEILMVSSPQENKISDKELELKTLFSSVIGNFIKSGDPGRGLQGGWPRYDTEKSYYLNFNSRPWVSNFLQRDKQDLWLSTVPTLLGGEPSSHDEL